MKSSISCALVFLLVLSAGGTVKEEPEAKDGPQTSDGPKKAEALFRRLFVLERAEQLAAVKALLKIGKEDKQKVMVQAIAEKVFSVIEKSRAILESSGYIPGVSDFPEDEKTRDALSNILENTAFFGDILLRLPDITELVLKNSTEWGVLFGWSVSFANQTRLLDNKTNILVDLVSQEMNYTKRNENFTNPYRKSRVQVPNEPPPETVKKKAKKKKKKVIPRGPRLSRPWAGEL